MWLFLNISKVGLQFAACQQIGIEHLERMELGEVKTYLNSGNVTFSSDKDDTERFTKQNEAMIKKQVCFGYSCFCQK